MYTKVKYQVINKDKQKELIHFQTSDDMVKIFDKDKNELGTLRELMFNGKPLSNADITKIKYSGTYLVTGMVNPPVAIEAGKTVILQAEAVGALGNPTFVHFRLVLQNGEIYHNTIVGVKQSGWSSGGAKLKGEINVINDKLTSVTTKASSTEKTAGELKASLAKQLKDFEEYKNHNHDDSYLKLSGGSLKGSLSVTSGNGFNFESAQGAKINLASYDLTNGVKIGSKSTALNIESKGDITHNGSKVWSADNDGKDSGLDADLLGGKSHTKYAALDTANKFTQSLETTGTMAANNLRIAKTATIHAMDNGRVTFKVGGQNEINFETNGRIRQFNHTIMNAKNNEVGMKLALNDAEEGQGMGFYRNGSSKYLGVYNWTRSERLAYFHHEQGHLHLDKAPSITGRRLYMQSGTPSGSHSVGDVWIS